MNRSIFDNIDIPVMDIIQKAMQDHNNLNQCVSTDKEEKESQRRESNKQQQLQARIKENKIKMLQG